MMKRSKKFNSAALIAITAWTLAACNSTPTTPETTPSDTSASTNVSNQPPISTSTPDSRTMGNKYPELRDPKNILSQRSVFFDFDSYVVQSQYISLVEAHSKFLKSHNDSRILIQGNADERGSSEYNLALGQKRADAVK